MHYLERVALRTCQPSVAERLFKKSLNLYKILLAAENVHFTLADVLHNLGLVLELDGTIHDAERLNLHSLIPGCKTVSIEYRITQDGMRKYLSNVTGKCCDAEKWCKQSLEMNRRIYGAGCSHLRIADDLLRLGKVAESRDMLDGAEMYYSQSLEMTKRVVHGMLNDNEEIASYLNFLGHGAQGKCKLDDAEWCYKQSLDM